MDSCRHQKIRDRIEVHRSLAHGRELVTEIFGPGANEPALCESLDWCHRHMEWLMDEVERYDENRKTLVRHLWSRDRLLARRRADLNALHYIWDVQSVNPPVDEALVREAVKHTSRLVSHLARQKYREARQAPTADQKAPDARFHYSSRDWYRNYQSQAKEHLLSLENEALRERVAELTAVCGEVLRRSRWQAHRAETATPLWRDTLEMLGHVLGEAEASA